MGAIPAAQIRRCILSQGERKVSYRNTTKGTTKGPDWLRPWANHKWDGEPSARITLTDLEAGLSEWGLFQLVSHATSHIEGLRLVRRVHEGFEACFLYSDTALYFDTTFSDSLVILSNIVSGFLTAFPSGGFMVAWDAENMFESGRRLVKHINQFNG